MYASKTLVLIDNSPPLIYQFIWQKQTVNRLGVPWVVEPGLYRKENISQL